LNKTHDEYELLKCATAKQFVGLFEKPRFNQNRQIIFIQRILDTWT